jgi:hypothetical protein
VTSASVVSRVRPASFWKRVTDLRGADRTGRIRAAF